MVLAIDIGNSSVDMGFFSGRDLVKKIKVPTAAAKAASLAGGGIAGFMPKNYAEHGIEGIIISSVVPEVTVFFHDSLKGLGNRQPLHLDSSLNIGIDLDVETPTEVGADRLADAVAARSLYEGPLIVADFGTATTLSAVIGRSFVGGAILPGMGLMNSALNEKTAKLRLVDLNPLADKDFHVPAVGKNTDGNIISGIIYGTSGAVERIVSGMEEEKGCVFNVIATGGYATTITRFLNRKHCLDLDLTLKGLRIIYERNV